MLNEQYIQTVVQASRIDAVQHIQSRRYKYVCGVFATQNPFFNDLCEKF